MTNNHLRRYYNEYPTISFNLPDDVKKKPKVTIDGAKFTYSNKYGSYDIDISKLKPGIHNITLYYPGDAKYPAKKVNDSFVIYASMNGKYSFEYEYGSKIKVSIKLPDDATGNLTVKINDSIYRSTPLKNGKATIMLPSNELGEYEYSAYYIGNYDVAPISNHITIIPKIKHTGNEIYPQTGKLTVDMGGNYNNATLVIFAEDIPIAEFDVTNKKTVSIDKKLLNPTRIIAKTYAAGGMFDDYLVTLDFRATIYLNNNPLTDIYWFSDYEKRIEAKNVKVTYNDGKVYKIRAYDLFGDAVGSGEKITVKIGSKKYHLKTNSKGIVSVKIKKAPGKYKVKIVYGDLEVKKWITVKHALSLSKVTVKKSAKKLVLTAKLSKKLKGKKITFKFAGKKYTAKTSKKGIAKVTIKSKVLKKLKVGRKITYKATYLKDTVKRSVKVKR